ncbi:bifunctional metallophosphatase/5'-nucleotidase [Ectobacillus sp. SYSU M60031]|uniref:Bifunctional metallophosphatase/5'-nucleotidase n=1 Tax=Ectobacillus ponti TaxID=2961894 RepID=A0AA41XB71_9BACI|nr:bifunctional metallophosphatase/5'-nucleotidase [Ectobacillus ponti]
MQQQKQHHLQHGEDVFVLDIGDHVDRFHPISEATYGKGNVALLNEAGYDFATIGNNEGITLDKAQLDDLYTEAHFPVLVANLYERDGSRPAWVKPYELRRTESGITIAFIGLTVAYNTFYSQLGWSVTDPMPELEEALRQVKGQADIVVVLSHLGRDADEYIGQHYDVDVVLGAHTHHLFETGLLVNGTLLCCTGKWGNYVGHVQLCMDADTKQVKGKQARVIASKLLGGHHKTEQALRQLEQNSVLSLQEQVAELPEELTVDWFTETPFAGMLADAVKEWCGTEIGMVNAGVLLESLPSGAVTKGDLHRICPHPINPCSMAVSGKILREVIIRARRPQTEQLEVKGFGFRGKVMGKMIYSGLEFTPDEIPGNKLLLREVLVNGEPLEPDRMYTIGTLDMFTFGYLFPELTHVPGTHYFLPETLRDVLRHKLVQHSSMNFS